MKNTGKFSRLPEAWGMQGKNTTRSTTRRKGPIETTAPVFSWRVAF